MIAHSAEWKLETFRRFFTTPQDVYAFRTKIRDKPGYVPIRERLTNQTIIRHMRGDIMIGSYTPLRDGTTPWVAADLDGKGGDVWGDAQMLATLLRDYGVETICNTSQSGKGIHVRIIFSEPIEARLARCFMLAFVEEAGLESMRDGGSFDRVFPVSDQLRKNEKSIGNQIAAPLHAQRARDRRGCLILDRQFAMIPLGDATWDHLDLYDFVAKPTLLAVLEEMGMLEDFIAKSLKGDLKIGADDDYETPPEHEEHEYRGRRRGRDLEATLRECELIKHVHENPVISYEMWFAIGANLKFFEDGGREAFHDISALDGSRDNRGNPRYDREATNEKFDNILDTVEAPYSCARIATDVWQCPELGEDGMCNKFRSRRTGRGPKAFANLSYFIR